MIFTSTFIPRQGAVGVSVVGGLVGVSVVGGLVGVLVVGGEGALTPPPQAQQAMLAVTPA